MAVDPLAQAVMVAYCGWDPTVAAVDAVILLDGNGTSLLTLPSLDVTDVSAVVVTDYCGDVTTATIGFGADVSNDVGWTVDGRLYWNSTGCWPVGQQNVSVTYSGGRNGGDVYLLAALNSMTKRIDKMGLSQAKIGTAALTYAVSIAEGGLLGVEQMIFDRYRLPRVA